MYFSSVCYACKLLEHKITCYGVHVHVAHKIHLQCDVHGGGAFTGLSGHEGGVFVSAVRALKRRGQGVSFLSSHLVTQEPPTSLEEGHQSLTMPTPGPQTSSLQNLETNVYYHSRPVYGVFVTAAQTANTRVSPRTL